MYGWNRTRGNDHEEKEKVIPPRDINFIIFFTFFSHRKKKKSPEINAVFAISDALHMLKIF